MTALLTDNLPLLAGAPNGIRKLRELILELAVRGKLVPQDPSDEPASALLKRIAEEKARLTAEGKIKKQKEVEVITSEDHLYGLPENWAWTRVGEVLSRISNGYTGAQSKTPTAHMLSRIETISRAEIDYSRVGYCVKISDEDIEKYSLREGDILLSHINSDIHLGKTALYKAEKPLIHGTNLLLLRPSSNVNPRFIDLHLTSLRMSGYFLSIAQHAIGQASVNQSKVSNIPFSLPPLAEQHRIVAKVDELMALCDRLEARQADADSAHAQLVQALLGSLPQALDAEDFAQCWQRLAEHFHTLFTTESSIDALKQTLLQLAVMGKLVPQDPNDEPASELIKRIEKEKITDKGKKYKSFNQVGLNEKLIALPTAWEWVCLGEVVEVASSKRINVSDYVSEGVPFFRSKEIGELSRGKDISTDIFISSDRYEALKELSGFPRKNDLMLTSVGSIGNTWLCDGRDFYYKDGNITKLRGRSMLSMRYLQLFIASSLFMRQVIDTVSGTAYSALTIIKLNGINFPLAPIPEQHRIVAKVDQLMALCDQIKARLNQASQVHEQLANALVEQAVA